MNVYAIIGITEKHKLSFRYSRLRTTVWVHVDGELVRRDVFRFWIPARRSYDIIVGNAETHDVRIQLSIPRFGAKFRNPSVTVLSDGQETPVMPSSPST